LYFFCFSLSGAKPGGRDCQQSEFVSLCFQGVVKWVESRDGGDAVKQQHLQSVLPLLRFSMMFPEQLLNIENSEFYQRHQDVMSPYLSLAHRFRSLASEVGVS